MGKENKEKRKRKKGERSRYYKKYELIPHRYHIPSNTHIIAHRLEMLIQPLIYPIA